MSITEFIINVFVQMFSTLDFLFRYNIIQDFHFVWQEEQC